MKTLTLLFIIGICCNSAFAQDQTDSDLMKSQSYMAYAKHANCDSMDGNNSEHKICLNLEFQEVDSILNEIFLNYISEIKNDSIKQLIVSYQQAWVLNRRIESSLEASEYRGHMRSISYISNMVFITRKRMEELTHLIEYK